MSRFLKTVLLLSLFINLSPGLLAGEKETILYKKEKSFRGKEESILSLDFSRIKRPPSIEAYHPVFHFSPIRQDTSGMCWCFSATSLLESELFRLGRGKIELSRLYTVYWEYVEKVRRFVQEKGYSLVDEGSQHNAVIARMRQYGAVRASDHTGLVDGATIYDHDGLIQEVKTYLDFVKTNKLWHENEVIANVRSILDRYLGKPPQTIMVDGRQMTPKEYLSDVLRLPLDDYVEVMSFKKMPFWTQDSYDVPDNWWHSKEYYNVPLEDFYDGIKSAIQIGYSLAIAGDISEPGNHGPDDIAIVPTFDLPEESIDQDSREFRFYDKTTKDDHGVHLVGYTPFAGEDWFLIKDSWDTAWRGQFKGYFFYRGDYIRLKILAYMVHKDGIRDLLQKYQKNHK
jgi:bleomycin hydrolase